MKIKPTLNEETKASKVKDKSSNIVFGVIRRAKDDADNPIKCVTNLYSAICNSGNATTTIK